MHTISVFAIHGLGSNPNSAWRYRGSGEGRTVDWLTEILPRQEGCQEIRITLLNHQTRWDSRTPQVDFTTHAKSMLSHVERINQGKRPIIFLAHSFGGLLLKQVCRDSLTCKRFRLLTSPVNQSSSSSTQAPSLERSPK